VNRLIAHHRYTSRAAYDLSANGNHGRLTDVWQGSQPFDDVLEFRDGASEIRVPPSRSLEDMRAIRMRIEFFLDPRSSHRFNLVESQLSFALFVEADLSLWGTIVDADGIWTGAMSVPGAVAPGAWHTAEFQHDGLSEAVVLLDDSIAARRTDVKGPVRPLGGRGLAIGHWAEPDPVYTFEGYLREMWLWAYDPRHDLADHLDPCCLDRSGLEALIKELRAEGWTSGQLRDLAIAIMDLEARIAIAAIDGDAERCDQLHVLTDLLQLGYRSGDGDRSRQAIEGLFQFVRAGLPKLLIDDFGSEYQALYAALPAALRDRARLTRIFCLSDKSETGYETGTWDGPLPPTPADGNVDSVGAPDQLSRDWPFGGNPRPPLDDAGLPPQPPVVDRVSRASRDDDERRNPE
jgi:hypothetical protein